MTRPKYTSCSDWLKLMARAVTNRFEEDSASKGFRSYDRRQRQGEAYHARVKPMTKAVAPRRADLGDTLAIISQFLNIVGQVKGLLAPRT